MSRATTDVKVIRAGSRERSTWSLRVALMLATEHGSLDCCHMRHIRHLLEQRLGMCLCVSVASLICMHRYSSLAGNFLSDKPTTKVRCAPVSNSLQFWCISTATLRVCICMQSCVACRACCSCHRVLQCNARQDLLVRCNQVIHSFVRHQHSGHHN